ncbi:MAG TPA: hypothetical protein VK706_16245, partial [Candidatus Sulfotelmatobacter sp.]|nr:hypothetical protein [Candidatus Sulfotelmatobacter sp.]
AQQVHQIVSEMNKPDQFGMTAGTNIRESLTNANTATANLADATEALKHNFLTRGFFKKRGYYNLSEISPDQYRKDRAFTDPKNHRVWLSTSELFQEGSNGEELSAKGIALLNAVLTENGDPIVDSPIVIEGYGNGDSPADRNPSVADVNKTETMQVDSPSAVSEIAMVATRAFCGKRLRPSGIGRKRSARRTSVADTAA